MIKVLELFGGIGAPRKALINLGIEHKSIDYVEWNEKAVRTYNAMFDNRYKSQSVVGYNLKPDILVHGSPCQDFSVAGKQYGGNIEDGTRSSLMFETIKIIENFGVWKPKVVIWENVKNALSKKMIGAFEKYLSDMERLGYTNSFEILDARDFGVPQARKRLFTISLLNGEYFNFKLLEHKKTKPLTAYLRDFASQHIVTQPSILEVIGQKGVKRATVIKEYAYTITTRQDRRPAQVVEYDSGKFRFLTEKECWLLMGFDDEDFDAAQNEHPVKNGKLNYTLYHQAGNSIVVQVLEAIFKTLIKSGILGK